MGNKVADKLLKLSLGLKKINLEYESKIIYKLSHMVTVQDFWEEYKERFSNRPARTVFSDVQLVYLDRLEERGEDFPLWDGLDFRLNEETAYKILKDAVLHKNNNDVLKFSGQSRSLFYAWAPWGSSDLPKPTSPDEIKRLKEKEKNILREPRPPSPIRKHDPEAYTINDEWATDLGTSALPELVNLEEEWWLNNTEYDAGLNSEHVESYIYPLNTLAILGLVTLWAEEQDLRLNDELLITAVNPTEKGIKFLDDIIFWNDPVELRKRLTRKEASGRKWDPGKLTRDHKSGVKEHTGPVTVFNPDNYSQEELLEMAGEFPKDKPSFFNKPISPIHKSKVIALPPDSKMIAYDPERYKELGGKVPEYLLKTDINFDEELPPEYEPPERQLDALQYLEELGWEFEDNRDRGGALWVYGPQSESKKILEPLKSKGMRFRYTKVRRRGKGGWWSKDKG